VPVIHRLVEMRGETVTTAADADADADANASRGPHQRRYPFAVVMCPSKELAAQVYRMANDLIAELNTRGTSAAPVAAGLFTQQLEQWPYFTDADPSPDIAICTPAFLAKFIKGPNIQDPDLFRSVRVLVMDEVRGAHRYLTARVCFLTAARLHT
jgi:superfamily II DNA/RNA helicase